MEEIIKSEFERRMINEGLSRILQCVNALDDESLWYQHNANTNSVGNLVLHLSGNVRQYILTGIDGQKDIRERPKEFLNSSRIGKKELLENISKIVIEANAIVQRLKVHEFTASRKVQGFDEKVLSIVMHVIEHFSYHVGQITFFTKYVNDIDTQYYKGQDLNITGQ